MRSSPQVRFAAAIVAINCSQLHWNRRAAGRPRFPAPEQPESLSMPTDQRIRLHNGQQTTPLDEVRQDDQRHARRIVGTTGLDLPFQVQRQLLLRKRFSAASWARDRNAEAISDARSRAMWRIIRN